jgi:RIO kinase 1
LDDQGKETDEEKAEDAAIEKSQGTEVSSQFRERMSKSERDNRFLRKDSSDRKTMEEVFDHFTMLVLNGIINREELAYLNGVVRAGKEARVYWGVAPDGTNRAVKIYLTSSAEFKKRLAYIVGDRRFGRVPSSSKGIIKLWVQKEFKNLQTASDAGVRVPKPISFDENILIMEYVGVPPAPAPIFAETEVDERDYRWTIKTVRRLYRKAGLVHADLSEYNIFKFGKERVLFDMGSSVVSSHPQAKEFLARDLFNVVRFFQKRGIVTAESTELLGEITS